MNRIFLFGWVFFINLFAYAGGEIGGTGARSFGIANASVTFHDPFALFNNIAGIGKTEHTSGLISCEIPFGILSLKKVSAALVFPYRKMGTGLTLSSFGNDSYHEFRAGFGIAHTIQNVSLGIKVNYNEIAIVETAVRRNLILEMGGISELNKRLHVGAFIYHWNKIFEQKENSALPMIMKAGLSYKISKELLITAEAEKSSYYKNKFKTGIEYTIAEKLTLRTGINTGIFTEFFGIGIRNKKFVLDYGLQSHPYLGLSHSLSFIFLIAKK